MSIQTKIRRLMQDATNVLKDVKRLERKLKA